MYDFGDVIKVEILCKGRRYAN